MRRTFSFSCLILVRLFLMLRKDYFSSLLSPFFDVHLFCIRRLLMPTSCTLTHVFSVFILCVPLFSNGSSHGRPRSHSSIRCCVHSFISSLSFFSFGCFPTFHSPAVVSWCVPTQTECVRVSRCVSTLCCVSCCVVWCFESVIVCCEFHLLRTRLLVSSLTDFR